MLRLFLAVKRIFSAQKNKIDLSFFQRIQLTATTPSNSAVRLETGAVEFEISNRVQNVQQPTEPHEVRLFARAQVFFFMTVHTLLMGSVMSRAVDL